MVTERRSRKDLDKAPWPHISEIVSKPDQTDARYDEDRPASHTPGPGYLGSTSFSAVYQEDTSLNDLRDCSYHQGTSHGAPAAKRLYMPNRDHQVKKGMSVLAAFVEHSNLEFWMTVWQQHYDSVTIMGPFASALKVSVGAYLYGAISQVQSSEIEGLLAQKSAEIYRNSMVEFRIPEGCTIDQYGAILADPQRLRWDALGLYFTAVGLGATHSNEADSRTAIEERRRLAKTMLEASDTCLSLCEELGQMTDAEVFLSCENAHLASLVEGDASKSFVATKQILQVHHQVTLIP